MDAACLTCLLFLLFFSALSDALARALFVCFLLFFVGATIVAST